MGQAQVSECRLLTSPHLFELLTNMDSGCSHEKGQASLSESSLVLVTSPLTTHPDAAQPCFFMLWLGAWT